MMRFLTFSQRTPPSLVTWTFPSSVPTQMRPGTRGDSEIDVMEQWVITDFESWYDWSPPHHLVGNGTSYLEEGNSYWLWAVGGETTWCGWCMNEDPYLTCPHTLRREGEDWLPIHDETASAFRVDVMPDEPCVGDLDGDGDTDQGDLGTLLADWGCMADCVGDLDEDDDTDQGDLGIMLADWGCGTSK